MEQSLPLENYNYYEKFNASLKSLKKNAKRKKRQAVLKNLTKILSHYQIISIIKFHPKLYLKPEEVLSFVSQFEDEKPESFTEIKIINLPKFEADIEDNLFFSSKNICLYNHISFPLNSNFDLNVDASLFTKNEFLFYSFDLYASYNVLDLKIKVLSKIFLFKKLSKFS